MSEAWIETDGGPFLLIEEGCLDILDHESYETSASVKRAIEVIYKYNKSILVLHGHPTDCLIRRREDGGFEIWR